MKVAVYKRPNEMAVIDIAKPRAATGEVLLKVHACGICGPISMRCNTVWASSRTA